MDGPAARVPRRLRRRILLVTLLAGLLPALAWGAAGRTALSRVLSVSLAPVEALLERVDDALEARGDPALVGEVERARLDLAQAELVRRRLAGLAPRAFLAGLLASAVLLAVAAAVLGRALTRRVEVLVEGMERLARGEPAPQLPQRQGTQDELDFLLAQFNRMSAELESQRARIKTAEQLAAWQDVARAMAHDLKNPLTAMKMAVARLARVEGDERLRESTSLLAEQIDVLIRLTESFSAFARLPKPQPRPVALGPLLEEVCALYRDAAPVPVECAGGAAPEVHADPDQLRRAFGNLVKNAVEASPPGAGPVRVEAQMGGGRVRVVVSDQGSGIGRVLEGAELTRGLATTKPGGAGLGLPLCHKIFFDHGGSLRLEPGPERGTRAVVELPLAPLVQGSRA